MTTGIGASGSALASVGITGDTDVAVMVDMGGCSPSSAAKAAGDSKAAIMPHAKASFTLVSPLRVIPKPRRSLRDDFFVS